MSELQTRLPAPVRRHEELPVTMISEGDVFVGRLEMSGNGQVLGAVDGQVSCAGELLIGPEARVRADLEAQDLVLAGRVEGKVVVRRRLKITTTGRLEGDAQASSLIVQEGGVHFGLLHVYPEGLPGTPRDAASEAAAEDGAQRPTGSPSTLSRPISASVDRVKKMWGEIF